ncbi:MAG: Hsp20/alpha crystallin family protein [Bacteroidales bacterium]|nr:Hsp20/alpha crystallin family protein [Bacteroidales bacterium]
MTLRKISNSMFPGVSGWQSSFPSIFDRLFEGDLMDWGNSNFAGSNSTLPAVNVKESDDHFEIEVAAPGLKKDDFRINYDNERLSLSCEKKMENEEKDGDKLVRREFSYQSFQRSFTVPENTVNADKIQAKYSEGILHVTLPKRDEIKPKPAKEIKIS